MTPISGIERAATSAPAGLGHAGFCQVAKAISYSRSDTAQTREEIAEHNCVGHALCGWPAGKNQCPEPAPPAN